MQLAAPQVQGTSRGLPWSNRRSDVRPLAKLDQHRGEVRFLYFLVYAVFPKTDHPDYGRIDGAYVSLFVHEPIQASAEAAAQAFIDEHRWDIEELDQAYPVEIGRYPVGHPGRERFEQAQIDGIVATFHTWPVGAPDED